MKGCTLSFDDQGTKMHENTGQYSTSKRRLSCVSKKALYLDTVGGALVGDVSGEALGDGGVVGVAAALVDLPGGALHAESRRLHVHRHVRQHEGDGLVLRGETGASHRAVRG